MYKKSLVIGLSLISSIVLAQKVPQNMVTLHGTLLNFSNEDQVQDLSEFQYLSPPNHERMVIPGSGGNFTVSFPLTAPNYFRLGRNILYLTPGDNMEVVIDKMDPEKSSFKGQGAAVNLYLRGTPYPKGGSFLESGSSVKATYKQTIDTILSIAKARSVQLSELTGGSKEFTRLETARIRAGIINSLESIAGYGPDILRLSEQAAKSYRDSAIQVCAPLIRNYASGFIDSSLMKIEVYRDIAGELVWLNGLNNADTKYIQDWQFSYRLVRKMNKQNEKSELRASQADIDKISTIKFRQAAQSCLNSLMAFGKGDKAVDFTALDMEGRKVKLSSLSGKVIYIDLWATWCGPCMKEMPYFEKLKEKYKDNPSVAFVSLSIDESVEGWKASVEHRRAGGLQWLTNRKDLDAYNIVGIPRILLIDKDYKMAEMNGPAPSEAAAVKAIESLL